MPLALHELLANGYFPKELPPPFAATSYATALGQPGASPPVAVASQQPCFSPCSDHSLLRVGAIRRHLKIPNPIHFYRLAEHVVAHWVDLESAARISPFSLSLPTINRQGRAIAPEYDLAERPQHRARVRANGRFLVKADIQRFFPSLYTHSLPWALLGKSHAKQMLANRTLSGTWQDRLDVLVRGTANNQTIGIPIGPDTSRLIAEVILGPVDLALSKAFRGLKGMRFIDDYEFVTSTRSEGEKVLVELQRLLNEFELELNPDKTFIQELPVALDPSWTSHLRTFVFRNPYNEVAQRNDLTTYFGLVFDYLKLLPSEGIVKYAIGRLKGVPVLPGNWRLYENILQQCVATDPACLPQVCDELMRNQLLGNMPHKRDWAKVLNLVITSRLPLGHSSECAWAMWALWQLKQKLLQSAAKVIKDTDDSVAALMGLALAHQGLADTRILGPGLQRFRDPAYLYEPQWLLCYEGNVRGWLGPGGAGRVQSSPQFAYLEGQNVRFMDLNPSVSPSSLGGGGGGGY